MSTDKIPTNDIINPDDLAAAEAEAAKAEAENRLFDYTHNFKKPFTYEGKTYETLSFDFGKLTGFDGIAIQEELDALGKPAIIPTTNANYLIRVAARACDTLIGVDVLCAMPLFDFNKITGAARSFLLRSGL